MIQGGAPIAVQSVQARELKSWESLEPQDPCIQKESGSIFSPAVKCCQAEKIQVPWDTPSATS